jgi:16S rRNA (cytidine1402-2'-O)-methyltransferase
MLGTVEKIYAEDTRTTRKLLSALDISAPPIVALHAHNERARAQDVANQAVSSEIALVSDAGTPGISDPGRWVVEACLAAGVEVRSVPGPSALAAALAASGFPVAPSAFLGFAPRKGRKTWCAQLAQRPDVLTIYEAPTRLPGLVRELAVSQPDREAVMCREISKRYEEIVRLPLAALSDELASRSSVKGECVLVLGPHEVSPARGGATESVDEGASLKQIAAALAGRWGVSKRDAYQALLGLDQEMRSES